LSGEEKGKKAWRMVRMVASSRPDLAPLAQRRRSGSRRDADGIADGAGRHRVPRCARPRVQRPRPDPAEVAALQRGLRLAELGGAREGHAAAELGDDVVDEAPHLRLLARLVHRDEDLGDEEFRLARAGALGGDEIRDLGFGGGGLRAEQARTIRAQPICTRSWS
jgi:hypothetical protein